MVFIELLLISIGLSMDASAVAMSNGMCNKTMSKSMAIKIALFFGIFQGAMPLIGYYAGSLFYETISKYDHIIALVLLSIIGGKMLLEAITEDDDDESVCKVLTTKALVVQSIATSIDALAVGISFAALSINIFNAVLNIGIVTFIASLASIYIGKKFGSMLNRKAEVIGGVILIGIGLKIFISHAM